MRVISHKQAQHKLGHVWAGGVLGIATVWLALHTATVAEPFALDVAQPSKIFLQPHRAVYDVTLARTASGSSIAALEGRLVYELSGNACYGYTQKLRFVTRTTNQIGDVRLSDLRTSNWESGTSDELRFENTTYLDNRLVKLARGTAEQPEAGGDEKAATGTVRLKKPQAKTLRLKPQTLFPIAHAKAVLRAALNRQTILQAKLFDGSDAGEKIFQTTAVIGRKIEAVSPPANATRGTRQADANEVASWPVAMSYFDSADATGDATPDLEMSYRFHLNGVTSRFVIDYGDFASRGELTQLVYSEAGECPSLRLPEN